jgi:glycyl-tRNA synthetase
LLDVFLGQGKEGFMFKFTPKLSPIKTAIFPLMKNNSEIVKISREIFDDLKMEWNVVYDQSGSVGRRYARQDEIGTPFCVTVDFDSLKNKEVTIRDRDTARQIKIKISEVKNILQKLFNNEVKFENCGKIVK